jgi:peptidoglycan LD-endopeptidase LytH
MINFQNEPIDWPLNSNLIRKNSIANTFGMVRKNSDGSDRPHQGWDFYAEEGTYCYSVARGKVVFADDRGALGNLLVISIGDTGYYAAYAHMSRIDLNVGDTVELGQLVGLTGNTGNASTMVGENQHLHLEIRDKPLTGLGLEGRISPLKVFKTCPLHTPEFRRGA